MKILVFIVVVVIVAVIVIIKMKNKPVIPAKEVEVLGMEELVTFFKQPEINTILKQNANLIAVAIREKCDDGNIHINATLFDKEKNSVADLEKHTAAWKAKKLDDRLTQAFDDKDMIILH